jgi:hypothetical protein
MFVVLLHVHNELPSISAALLLHLTYCFCKSATILAPEMQTAALIIDHFACLKGLRGYNVRLTARYLMHKNEQSKRLIENVYISICPFR